MTYTSVSAVRAISVSSLLDEVREEGGREGGGKGGREGGREGIRDEEKRARNGGTESENIQKRRHKSSDHNEHVCVCGSAVVNHNRVE